MKKLFQKLPLYVVGGAMVLSGCAVVAEAPGSSGQNMGRERQERRDDDRRDRDDDRRGDKHDKKRGDRDDDRRGGRDDDRRGGGSVQVTVGGYFGERQRSDAYAYYGQPPRAHCPPGLAKKNNGCQPPGQAKKWKLGQPLPRDIGYRPIEPELRVRIGIPPAGYEYVRVAQDILMIAVGTAIVMDAIEDLQR
jgi:Ni/Co efflux regulator RcnB